MQLEGVAQRFNGATSRSWWKAGVYVVTYPSTFALQWSHQPELVEGGFDDGPMILPALQLQWSHQPELVEGAYPSPKGNLCVRLLQWSHQPELVEGTLLSKHV